MSLLLDSDSIKGRAGKRSVSVRVRGGAQLARDVRRQRTEKRLKRKGDRTLHGILPVCNTGPGNRRARTDQPRLLKEYRIHRIHRKTPHTIKSAATIRRGGIEESRGAGK